MSNIDCHFYSMSVTCKVLGALLCPSSLHVSWMISCGAFCSFSIHPTSPNLWELAERAIMPVRPRGVCPFPLPRCLLQVGHFEKFSSSQESQPECCILGESLSSYHYDLKIQLRRLYWMVKCMWMYMPHGLNICFPPKLLLNPWGPT